MGEVPPDLEAACIRRGVSLVPCKHPRVCAHSSTFIISNQVPKGSRKAYMVLTSSGFFTSGLLWAFSQLRHTTLSMGV